MVAWSKLSSWNKRSENQQRQAVGSRLLLARNYCKQTALERQNPSTPTLLSNRLISWCYFISVDYCIYATLLPSFPCPPILQHKPTPNRCRVMKGVFGSAYITGIKAERWLINTTREHRKLPEKTIFNGVALKNICLWPC